ncbi:hypothetical protein AB833_26520 [Chromatiales bacterium (ex Bugula neritina AB1)]|nr:hypothetical protein AB833_26520 [Chromatiales bacterium (ex Bugula neritina AB1)]
MRRYVSVAALPAVQNRIISASIRKYWVDTHSRLHTTQDGLHRQWLQVNAFVTNASSGSRKFCPRNGWYDWIFKQQCLIGIDEPTGNDEVDQRVVTRSANKDF